MSKLLKSTGIVSLMTFFSRILGFLRDMVVASYFGAGRSTDAFFVAFKIPNFLRRLFAEGAFAQAFVPVLSEYKTQRDHNEVKQLVAKVAGTLGAVVLLISILGALFAPALIYVFAPGFTDDPEKFELAAGLLSITFPYILFMSLVALSGGVLNSFSKFAVPAFTPVLLNVVLIAAAICLAPLFDQPEYALAIGVFVAGAAQLGMQLPALAKLGLLPRPRFGARDEGVRRIMRLMLPIIIASSVSQISLLLDTILASFLRDGSVSWLYFADRLMEFPLAIFIIALSTVILPSLSRQHASQDPTLFADTLDWAMRIGLMIAAPAAVGLIVLATPLITTLFQYGQYSTEAATMSGYALTAYGFGLLGFSMVKILVPGFSARQDTKTPAKIAMRSLLVGMIANIVIVVPLYYAEVSWAHVGLAAATSVSAFVNAFWLYRALSRDGVYAFSAQLRWMLPRILVACVVMGGICFWLAGPVANWFAYGAGERALRTGVIIAAAVATYFAILVISGVRPRHFKRSA